MQINIPGQQALVPNSGRLFVARVVLGEYRRETPISPRTVDPSVQQPTGFPEIVPCGFDYNSCVTSG